MAFKTFGLVATIACLAFAPMAMAQGQGGGNSGGNGNQGNGPDENSTKTVTVEVTETNTYMGNSTKAPPNEKAAASQGTSTVETTYSVDVTGHAGQVNPYKDDQTKGCEDCTFSAPYNESSVVIDAPGKN